MFPCVPRPATSDTSLASPPSFQTPSFTFPLPFSMDPSSSAITLRPFELSDAGDFLSWAGNDRVTRYLRWDSITSLEAAESYLRNVAIPHPCRRSICLGGHSIGYVSVRPGSGDERCRTHVSYAVGVEFWGRGFATAALRMAARRVFDEMPDLVRLEAFVEVENKGSQRVLEKVGFVKEGLLRKYGICKGEVRDMYVYSLLSTDEILG